MPIISNFPTGDAQDKTYGSCATGAATAAKVVVLDGFKLEAGATIAVKFTNANTAANPTLNVNDTGAKAIMKYGTTAAETNMWQAGAVVAFAYDGTNWVMEDGTTATTTYYGITKLSSATNSTATNLAATPSAVKAAYDLANGKLGTGNIKAGEGVFVNVSGSDVTISTIAAKSIPGVSKVLDDNTWAKIAQVSDALLGPNYWAVGDRKAVAINGTVGTLAVNATYYVYILGFNHNSALEGTGIHFGGFKTALTGGTDICLTDSYYPQYQSYNGTKYFQMNHRNSGQYGSNYGGWAACDMRYDILGSTDQAPSGYGADKTAAATGQNPTATCATSPVANTLMAALPADLRAVMKPMTKYTDNKGNASNVASGISTTIDYLPLLAEYEIFGAHTYANQFEQNYQKQYAYYAAGNSRVKYQHGATSSTAYWWERSPIYDNARYFCSVYTNGDADYSYASYSLGLAPAFKV